MSIPLTSTNRAFPGLVDSGQSLDYIQTALNLLNLQG